MHWAFWISILLLLYTFAGYPLLVTWWARRSGPAAREAQFGDADEQGLPRVSVVISALNEEEGIGERIENILDQDYPADRFELLLASDGSDDATVEKARAYASERVRIFPFEMRRGKPSVLNELLPQARGEIVLMADARQRFDRRVMRRLAERFADPEVGAVSGELRFVEKHDSNSVGEGIGFYWHYEKYLRRKESDIDSTVGVTGAVYALRKSLFQQIPGDTILDDVLIPMQVVRQGYRVGFESSAVALDVVSEDSKREFGRKVRTLAGNFQLFSRHPWLLRPRHNRLWLQTWSHKVMRLLAPPLMLLALLLNIAVAEHWFYALLLLAQIAFYGAALIGYLQGDERRKPVFISIPYTFCLLNAATVVGFFRFVRGKQQVTWQKTDSKSGAQSSGTA